MQRVMPELSWDVLPYLAKGAAAIVAWFLVVLGWAVANDLAAQRERKKSDEGKLEQLRRTLEEIEELAVTHHSSAYDEARARKIGRMIKGVGATCSHLERCRVITSDWRAANIEVKRAVTMQNFEKSGHRIRSSGDEIVLALEGAFFKFQSVLMRMIEDRVNDAEPLRHTLKRMLKRL